MLKLTYFPFAGRGYAIRTSLGLGGIAFEDEKIAFPDFKAKKEAAGNGRTPEWPLGTLPVLTLPNGKIVTQSLAIGRYVAKLAKLYPEDPEQAMFVDELLETVGDMTSSAPQNADQDVKKKLREEWAAGKLTVFYSFLAERLEQNGGPYFFGSQLTIADIQIYSTLKSIRNGNFDFVPGSFDQPWPIFQTFINNIESHPKFGPFKIN